MCAHRPVGAQYWHTAEQQLLRSMGKRLGFPPKIFHKQLGKYREKGNGRKLELLHEGLGAQGERRIQ